MVFIKFAFIVAFCYGGLPLKLKMQEAGPAASFLVLIVTAFRYQKTQYNVFEVNQTGYDNCTTEGAVGNWTSGKDFILLTDPKRYYFICGNGQCLNGMKVTVLVHPLPSPPPSSVAAKNSSAAAPVVYGSGFVGLRVVMGLITTICVGSGWI